MRIFTSSKAVFTDVTAEDYQNIAAADQAQARSLVLFPVKIPYLENALDPVSGGVAANSAVPVRVIKSLCVNKSLSLEAQAQAQNFADWFVTAEKYGDDPIVRDAAYYLKKGDTLPYSDTDTEYEAQMTRFTEIIAESDGLPLYLADQIWDEEKTAKIRGYLKAAWSRSVD
jgi:hypothetical protein